MRGTTAGARADADRLWVQLADGRELSLPLTWFDFLSGATEKRQGLRVVAGGDGIWWDEIDEGVSVPGLLGLPEYPPPDPTVRTYIVDYQTVEHGWDAEPARHHVFDLGSLSGGGQETGS